MSSVSPSGDRVAFALDDHVEIRDLQGMLKRTLALDAEPMDWEDEILLLRTGRQSTVYRVGAGEPQVVGSGTGWDVARWAGGGKVLLSTGSALLWLHSDGSVEDADVPAYSADLTRDGRIVFADSDGKRSRVFMETDGAPQQQTQLDGEVVEIATASDADRLVLVNLKVQSRFRLLDLAGDKVVAERVLPLPSDQEIADLLPDGSGVTWMEINPNIDPGSRDTKVDYSIWRLSLEGEKLEEISNVNAAAWPSFAGVSRDQRTRYQYERLDAVNGRIVHYSPFEPGDPVEVVAMRRGLAHCFQLAPDGESLAITDRGGFLHVLPVDAAITSLPEPRTPKGWHTQHWAVDSAELYVIQRDKGNTLAAYNPTLRAFRELAERVESIYVAGLHKLVVRRGSTLTMLDTRTGKESPFLEAKSETLWIQFTPDGKQALMTEFKVHTETWMAELTR